MSLSMENSIQTKGVKAAKRVLRLKTGATGGEARTRRTDNVQLAVVSLRRHT